MIIGVIVIGNESKDVPVDIERILEVSDLIFKVVVLLS